MAPWVSSPNGGSRPTENHTHARLHSSKISHLSAPCRGAAIARGLPRESHDPALVRYFTHGDDRLDRLRVGQGPGLASAPPPGQKVQDDAPAPVLPAPPADPKLDKAPDPFAIRGRITGLAGSGLVLATEGQPDLEVAKGATTFAFAKAPASGTPYAVTVLRQPSKLSQTCKVTDGSGVVGRSRRDAPRR